jgi:hypothetical protein
MLGAAAIVVRRSAPRAPPAFRRGARLGIVIGYLALGEVPTVYQLAGLAVVAVGFRLALKQ